MSDNTFTIEVTLPATLDIESRGQITTLDVAQAVKNHGPSMVADGFTHGIIQKISDAAASALKLAYEADTEDKAASPDTRKAWGAQNQGNSDATDAMALNLMESAARNTVENGWTSRRVNSTADPLDAYRIAVVRKIILDDKKSKSYKGYAAIDAKDQSARRDYLLALAAKNVEAVDALAYDAMAADKAKAETMKGISFDT